MPGYREHDTGFGIYGHDIILPSLKLGDLTDRKDIHERLDRFLDSLREYVLTVKGFQCSAERSAAEYYAESFGLHEVARRISRMPLESYEWQVNAYSGNKSPDGFVYLMHSQALTLYKIGFSKNPDRRLRQLRSNVPDLQLVHTISTANMPYHEAMFHDRYRDLRVMGEWFNLSSDDIADFCSYEGL